MSFLKQLFGFMPDSVEEYRIKLSDFQKKRKKEATLPHLILEKVSDDKPGYFF